MIAPFYPSALMYTCSAMTHIYEDIRIDAFRFIQFWIQSFPNLTAEFGTERLLPNFISNLANDRLDATIVHSKERSLKVDPNSRLGLSKTRSLVLSCLDTLLHITLTRLQPSCMSNATRAQRQLEFNWSQQSSFQCPLLSTSVLVVGEPLDVMAFVSFDITSTKSADEPGQSVYRLTDISHIEALIKELQPLLIQLWLETANTLTMGSTATGTTIKPLYSILKIGSLLWRYWASLAKEECRFEFVESFISPLVKHVLPQFPFGQASLQTKVHNVFLYSELIVYVYNDIYLYIYMII